MVPIWESKFDLFYFLDFDSAALFSASQEVIDPDITASLLFFVALSWDSLKLNHIRLTIITQEEEEKKI